MTSMIDNLQHNQPDLDETTDSIQFECTRDELRSSSFEVPTGVDLAAYDIAATIDAPLRYTSIVCEKPDGTRAYEMWWALDYVIVHGVPHSPNASAPGAIVARHHIDFFVAQMVVTLMGQFSDTRAAYDFEAADQEGADNSQDCMLIVASGTAEGRGPRIAILNSNQGTYGGSAAAEVDTIDVAPIGPTRAWAMIVDGLHSCTGTTAVDESDPAS